MSNTRREVVVVLARTALGGVLSHRRFYVFWSGFTVSALGDAMARTALVWYVFETTRSPQAVGTFLLAFTGPVVVGGLFAGVLLDRFDRARLMMADSLARGAVTLAVPVLAALGLLDLWQLYGVAVVYGLLMMIPLAGVPSVLPDLVDPAHLNAANSLETIGYTVAGVLGPALAGLIVARAGAPLVVGLDGLTFLAFAASLYPRSGHLTAPADARFVASSRTGMADAVGLVRRHPVLLATTLMFCSFNLGYGVLAVWLPVVVDRLPGGGATLYGVILAIEAVGQLAGSIVSAASWRRVRVGVRICAAQVLSGASLALALVGGSTAWLALAVFGLGLFSGPLTVWAQTLRMKAIPAEMRGRTFALLRTLMQAAGPAASGGAGPAVAAVGIVPMMAASVGLIGLPGAAALWVPDLRSVDA